MWRFRYEQRFQHTWATAVETVGVFTGDNLKSGDGDVRWLQFFGLMGCVHAIREGTAPIPGYPKTLSALRKNLRQLDNEIGAATRLAGYNGSLDLVASGIVAEADYYVLELDYANWRVQSWGFSKRQFSHSFAWYQEREKTSQSRGVDVVMVRGASVAGIKRAYPNYFGDTTEFLASVHEVID